MNFGLTEEQELLRKTARDFLAERSSMPQVREIMESEAPYSKSLWKEFSELGWTGLALPEEFGGAGLSPVELAIVCDELGRCLAPVPFLPTCIVSTALADCGTETQQRAWLPRIAAGDGVATLAIKDAKQSRVTAREAKGEFVLQGRKHFVPDAQGADLYLVVAQIDDGASALFLVPREAQGLTIRPMRSMDLLRPLSELEFADLKLPADALLGGLRDVTSAFWRAIDRAIVMISAEMVGGAERCLEASVQHAKDRVQFGKPIGVNQAIKHKCADMLFEVESAKSITYLAAWAAREEDAEAPLLAAMAKSYSGQAYRHVAAENLQIHGGVGFTWEYDCHLFLKRARSSEAWLGDSYQHRRRVADLMKI